MAYYTPSDQNLEPNDQHPSKGATNTPKPKSVDFSPQPQKPNIKLL
jgi:hypothetical protein